MIAHTFNSSAWEQKKADFSEFEVRLVNMVNSRIAKNMYHFKGKKNGLYIYVCDIYYSIQIVHIFKHTQTKEF